jgi:hypothetical protein
MNVRLLQCLSLVGLVAMIGCSKDEDDTDDSTVKDTGVVTDTGVVPDTGVVDTGVVDTGTGDTGVDPCPNGTEGCECNSTLGMNDMAFKKDDCNDGLLCVPWDQVTGRTMDVTAPVHSCVKPCANDGECGASRHCAQTSFPVISGAESICFDELAGLDEFCHLSRLSTSRISMVPVEKPGIMAGCADGVRCSPGGAANRDGDDAIGFTDVHPDNGICMTFCRDQADCANISGLTYCNPRYTAATSTNTAGVCSAQMLNQIGAICGAVPPGNPNGIGLSNGCDAAVNLDCLGVTGLFPTGVGFCGQFCDNATPCTAQEPGGEAYTCSAAPGNNPMGQGLCTWDGANNFPDECAG